MTTALYRRYRPETFADVIGQEHVTEPLMQALRTGRVNHAYLFSGPRGCGKTTSARILARCLNCEQGPTPKPCGVCDSCVALARGGPGSVDVIEIDAASHGGVDDARDLRERASFGPASSRFKIYIIDEAHMVTPQGFNALLKIVEEPPEHVKFVFATTEPEKVIGTIRSRTHHYPFRLVPPKKLADYMERLLEAENVAVEPGVLSFVTRAGGGSVRDSLSVLDQLIAGSGPEGLTYAGAAGLLGFTDEELLDGIVEAFGAGDSAAVFRQIDKVVEAGADPRRFVEDLLERLRDLIVIAAVPDGVEAVLRSVPEDQLERMRGQAAAFGPGALSRAADVINAGLSEMTGATSPRLQLELMCARVLLPGIAGIDGYAARLDRMERRLDMGELPPRSQAGPVPHAPAADSTQRPAGQSAPPPGREVPAPSGGSGPSRGQGHDQLQGAAAASDDPAADRQGPASGASGGVAPAEREREQRWFDEAQQAGGPGQRPAESRGAGQRPTEHPGPAPSQGAGQQPRPRGGMTTDDIRRAWPDVLDRIFRIKRVTWTLLSQNAQVLEYDGQRLVLGASSAGLATTMSRGQHPEVVRQALVEAIGVDVTVEAQAMDEAGASARASAGSGASSGVDEAGQQARPDGGWGAPAPDGAGDPRRQGPSNDVPRGSGGDQRPSEGRHQVDAEGGWNDGGWNAPATGGRGAPQREATQGQKSGAQGQNMNAPRGQAGQPGAAPHSDVEPPPDDFPAPPEPEPVFERSFASTGTHAWEQPSAPSDGGWNAPGNDRRGAGPTSSAPSSTSSAASPSGRSNGRPGWRERTGYQAGADGQGSHAPVDPRQAGDPPAQVAPQEAATPQQDVGLATAAAQSSAWGSSDRGDWASQSGPAPSWADGDDEPVTEGAPDAGGDDATPAWMEDEPETDVEAVFDPLPPRENLGAGGRDDASDDGSSAAVDASAAAAADPEASGSDVTPAPQPTQGAVDDGRQLSPRQRAEKMAREAAQREEDARLANGGVRYDDTSASIDDEDIENFDAVGLPVIKSVLGGTVIKEEGPGQG